MYLLNIKKPNKKDCFASLEKITEQHGLLVFFLQARGSCGSFIFGFVTFMSIGGFPSFVEDMKVKLPTLVIPRGRILCPL